MRRVSSLLPCHVGHRLYVSPFAISATKSHSALRLSANTFVTGTNSANMSYSSTRNHTPSSSLYSTSAPRSIPASKHTLSRSTSTSNAVPDVYTSSYIYSRRCSFTYDFSQRPNSYISDEDLFGDDDDEHYLKEAPPPPRPAQVWCAMAQPLLPPVSNSRRRHRSGKARTLSKSSSTSK